MSHKNKLLKKAKLFISFSCFEIFAKRSFSILSNSTDDLLVVFLLPERPLLVGLDLLQVGHGGGVNGETVLENKKKLCVDNSYWYF